MTNTSVLLMITAKQPADLTRNEGLKAGSTTLSGTIAQSLADPSTDRFSDDDYEFLKFHGIYQQDDRDQRKVAKHYMLMVRTKFPGGVLTAPAVSRLRPPVRRVREQHHAHHDAPGFSVSRHPEVEYPRRRSKPERGADVHHRGLRRREPQCDGSADASHEPAGG